MPTGLIEHRIGSLFHAESELNSREASLFLSALEAYWRLDTVFWKPKLAYTLYDLRRAAIINHEAMMRSCHMSSS